MNISYHRLPINFRFAIPGSPLRRPIHVFLRVSYVHIYTLQRFYCDSDWFIECIMNLLKITALLVVVEFGVPTPSLKATPVPTRRPSKYNPVHVHELCNFQ